MHFRNYRSPLFIKDGGKLKPSKLALTLLGGLCVAAVVGMQFLSSVRTQQKAAAPVDAPKIDLSKSLHPPAVTSAYEAERASEKKAVAQKMKSMLFQPLKAISLQHLLDVPIGSEVSATLSSGGSNGTVTALLDASVEADGDAVLPKGTLLYGKGIGLFKR